MIWTHPPQVGHTMDTPGGVQGFANNTARFEQKVTGSHHFSLLRARENKEIHISGPCVTELPVFGVTVCPNGFFTNNYAAMDRAHPGVTSV